MAFRKLEYCWLDLEPILVKYLQNCSAILMGSDNSSLPDLNIDGRFYFFDLLSKTSFSILQVLIILDFASSIFLP